MGKGYPVRRDPGPGTAVADPDVTRPGLTAQRCAGGWAVMQAAWHLGWVQRAQKSEVLLQGALLTLKQ